MSRPDAGPIHSTASKGALQARLAPVLSAFPEVQAAYLFGSVATGQATAASDLDLGIVTEPPLGDRKLAVLTALADAGFDNVDLVSLDEDDVVLRFEAVRPNRLVYAKDHFDHGAFYSRTVREYFDFLPILERQREALKRRLQGASR